VRHMSNNGVEEDQGTQRGIRREPSDEVYDEYEDQYLAHPAAVLHGQPNAHAQLDEDLPDTTMLDSVILPAIASVRLLTDTLTAWR
jgi:serine/threonine-protein kinase 24/25/MST4